MNKGTDSVAEPAATVEGDWMNGTEVAVAGGEDWGAAPAAAAW